MNPRGWQRLEPSGPSHLLWTLRAEDSCISVYLHPTRQRLRYHLTYQWAAIFLDEEVDDLPPEPPSIYRLSATGLGHLFRSLDREIGYKHDVRIGSRQAVPWWCFRPCDLASGQALALRALLCERLRGLSADERAEWRRHDAAQWHEILRTREGEAHRRTVLEWETNIS